MAWLLICLSVPAVVAQGNRLPPRWSNTGVATGAQVAGISSLNSCPPPGNPPPEITDLASLWTLAQTHNPTLREAAARVEMARGKHLQARKYPNPQFTYE